MQKRIKIYDVVIIGGGPAGLSAFIYLLRANCSVLLITKQLGGQVAFSGIIENYLGIETISGFELSKRFKKQIFFLLKENLNSDLFYKSVVSVTKQEYFTCLLDDNSRVLSHYLLLTTGTIHKKLSLKGEEEFNNRGLSYCVVCDGTLFKNKIVAVIGGGNSALDGTLFLSKLASKIYVINKNEAMKGDKILLKKCLENKKVKFFFKAKTLSFSGSKNGLTQFSFLYKGLKKILKVDGVFIKIGLKMNLFGIKMNFSLSLNRNSEIKIQSDNSTNIERVYAAGDATNIPFKQLVISAGEGAKAALSILKKKRQEEELKK